MGPGSFNALQEIQKLSVSAVSLRTFFDRFAYDVGLATGTDVIVHLCELARNDSTTSRHKVLAQSSTTPAPASVAKKRFKCADNIFFVVQLFSSFEFAAQAQKSERVQSIVNAAWQCAFQYIARQPRDQLDSFCAATFRDSDSTRGQSDLTLQLSIPDSATNEEIRQAILDLGDALDNLHRAHDGSGITIDSLEIDGKVPTEVPST